MDKVKFIKDIVTPNIEVTGDIKISGNAYMGNEEDIKPLATRAPEAEMKNGALVKWNADTSRLENGMLVEEAHIRSLKFDENNVAGAKGVYFAEIHPGSCARYPALYDDDSEMFYVLINGSYWQYSYEMIPNFDNPESDDHIDSFGANLEEYVDISILRKGYYYANIEQGPYVILSDNQFAPASEGFTMPSDWAVGDHLTILDWFNYDYCSVITRINGNRVYCDYIPETEEQYATVINCDLDKLVVNIDKPLSGLVDAGYNAVVFGEHNTSILQDAFVNGLENTALGKYAFVTGRRNKAGYASAVFGNNNSAIGEGHIVTGSNNNATGERNFVGGIQSNSDGRATMAFGIRASATGESQTVVGKDNIVRDDAYFIVGNGANSKNKSNAIVVNTNGGIELGNINGNFTDVNGEERSAGAAAKNSVAINNLTRAEGVDSVALGLYTVASGTQAVSLGKTTQASGNCTVAEGYNTKATASCAHAAGKFTVASASNSYAGGYGCQATADSQYVIGQYNNINDDALFIVGNGSSEKHSNAFEVLKNGSVKVGNATFTLEELSYLNTLIDKLRDTVQLQVRTDDLDFDYNVVINYNNQYGMADMKSFRFESHVNESIDAICSRVSLIDICLEQVRNNSTNHPYKLKFENAAGQNITSKIIHKQFTEVTEVSGITNEYTHFICSIADTTNKEIIAKIIEHDLVFTRQDIIDCTTGSVINHYKCRHCDELKSESGFIAAQEHSFDDTGKCTRCNYICNHADYPAEYRPYQSSPLNSTNGQGNSHKKYCSNCGCALTDTYSMCAGTAEADGCNYTCRECGNIWTQHKLPEGLAWTSNEDNTHSKTGYCENCKKTITLTRYCEPEVQPQKGLWVTTHDVNCKVCGYNIDHEDCTWDDSFPRICKYCGGKNPEDKTGGDD